MGKEFKYIGANGLVSRLNLILGQGAYRNDEKEILILCN